MINGVAAAALIILALFVAFSAIVKLKTERRGGGVIAAEGAISNS